ncbi:questin oxidase family protein [Streptomyces sp. NPDC012751]|uniref:questin oxidase family protein n=1 Tax=Streptomyces sp. NPDC012751 TaxID=3364846 RepID=UPI0036A0A0C9
MDIDGTLDEAYERLHRTGPEFDGWLSNHGPMAVEALVRHGHAHHVHHWLDRYMGRLDEPPRGLSPVTGADWRTALGDPRRLGDWLAFFGREVRERPWRAVLETWWPRLLPGIAAGATHGVIRTGHAVHALLDHADGARLTEFGQALGYWAARWQPVPLTAPAGRAGAAAALAGMVRVPDQSAGINHRLGQLSGLPGWPAALAALRVLPALPRAEWVASLHAAWAASAAVTAAYAPAGPMPADGPPAAPGTAEEVFALAVRHGDEHVIKLADTCLDVHRRTGRAEALAAVVRSAALIEAPAG